jgi:hypothetical protein
MLSFAEIESLRDNAIDGDHWRRLAAAKTN